MPASFPADRPVLTDEQLLPSEVTVRSESWLTRARNYPVFSRTWYRYRAIAWLGTLVPTLFLLAFVGMARGAEWRTFLVSWIPLALSGTSMHLTGAALAVWVRQQAYPEKKEWNYLLLVLLTGMVFSLGVFFATRQVTQDLTNHHVSMLVALDLKRNTQNVPEKPALTQETIERSEHSDSSGNQNWIANAWNDFTSGFKDGYEGKPFKPMEKPSLDFWKGFFVGLVLAGMIIFLSGGYDLWLFSRQRNMLKAAQSKRDVEQAKALQRETELRLSVLVAQVEPHFLFNTLAGVRSAVITEPQRAVAIIDHLVDYLRATIPEMRDDGGTVQGRLRKQLETIHAYLNLMQARIPRLSFSIDSDIDDAALPPLMLISLVENAVKHGVEPKVGAAHIWVKASLRSAEGEQQLEISVSDDGVGFGGNSSGSGIGLANIHERLASIYGARASLTLHSRAGGGVIATITLPFAA